MKKDFEYKYQFIKPSQITFETNLRLCDIMNIVDMYIKSKGELYEIERESVLYDKNSYVTNEPVWYVEVIPIRIKKRWPDAYESLAISDKEGRVVYVQNYHGVVIERF